MSKLKPGFASTLNFDYPKIKEVIFLDLEESIHSQIPKMVDCDLIITCGDWESNQNCEILVDIARLLEIEVIHQIRFKEYAQENYN